MEVFIRTRGRINEQSTLEKFFLLEAIKEFKNLKLRIVMPVNEKKVYLKAHPDTKRHIVTVPNKYKSGDVFQFINEEAKSTVFCLDDDLSLGRRRDPYSSSQKGSRATKDDVVAMFKRAMRWLKKGYKHGGMSLRQNNHYVQDDYFRVNTRICCGASFWDAKVLRKENIHFDDLQARSCCHAWLSLLEKGYDNVCDYEFIIGQVTNSKGGCSDYRTPEFMEKQAQQLVDLHPGVVIPFYKKRKGEAYKAIQTDLGVPDVKVYWRKASQLKEKS